MTAVAPASLRKDGEGKRPFERVLVANRGEIAVRIIRACRELGIDTVAVYSDADVDAAHVRLADESVRLGPAPAVESYLRADAIVDAARQTGAEAIHPGYGFLAERAGFARAVEDAGIVFVGPSSATIAALGDKLGARRAAAAAGVAVVPGTLEPAAVDRPDALESVIDDAVGIGFPLLVKAAAGGGGRGMRRVTTPEELPAALAAGSAEATASFGDGTVYLEREILPARHIEVQLIGDRQGTVIALGERDCSLQRRHQKLVEESPAPGLDASERRALHASAITAAVAAHLENAATAEFLFDSNRRFWFLEVNTRLQVEHGVTELVADVDLVREQLFVAAGWPLSERIREAAEVAAEPSRHAIQVRLSAEDPARDFTPAPGWIGRWEMPGGPGVRVDTAVGPGARVPPDYDPLIAKILVVDGDRASAIRRLQRALAETVVTGIQTTLPFHLAIAADRRFGEGGLSIDWVDEHWAELMRPGRAVALDAARIAAIETAAARAVDGPPREPLVAQFASEWARAARSEGRDRWHR